MSAAALRLGGRALLRRTQPQGPGSVFSEQQRRLFGKTRASNPQEKKQLAIRLAEIDEKKEELYSMAFDVVSKYRLPRNIGRQNRLLLERLSVQVQPRPNDLYWRSRRRMERTKRVVLFVGAHTLFYTAVSGLFWLGTEVRIKERNWWDDVEHWCNGVFYGKKSWTEELYDWWNTPRGSG
ncbi:hypothetical protein ACQ4PT_040283 [Festuca glaucescens]